LREDNLLNNN